MDNSITFLSKTFRFWPLSGRNGLGFIEKASVTISGGEILVEWKNVSIKYNINDLEYVFRKNRFFNLRNPAMYLGNSEKSSTFYIHHKDYEKLLIALRQFEPLCFSSETEMLEEEFKWYQFFKHLFGIKKTVWINSKNVFSSEKITNVTSDRRSHSAVIKHEYVATEEIKYFYTRGIIYNNLYVGCDTHYIKLVNASNDTVKRAQLFLSSFIGNITDEIADVYNDVFTLNVIFKPSLWFAHSSIGFNDKGIVYKQKTFKTNDNVFIPFEKINNLNYEGKWYWFTTKKLILYGEQNILPLRRYSKWDAHKIAEKLKKEGIKTISGIAYKSSYHTSWFGILLSILTIGLYHWIIVAFSKKRDKLIISENIIIGNSKIYTCTPEANRYRQEIKGLTSFICDIKDVKSAIYVKKHWYHLWGRLFIWSHPSNIREHLFEANQHSIDYDSEIGKIWSWNAKRAISDLRSNGYYPDSERDKSFKKWAKSYLGIVAK